VISVLDLLPVIGKDLGQVLAEDLMHPCQFTVDPQLSIEEAVALMEKHQVEYLVISDAGTTENRPVGILTSYDIVRCIARIKVGRIMGPLRLAAG
jgi:predicted transcriptional regulator